MDASQTILDDALRRIAQLERDVESRRNYFHEKHRRHQTKRQNRRSVIRDYSSSSRYTPQQASRNSQYRGYVRRRYSSSSSSSGTTRSSGSRSGENLIRNSRHNDGERIARRTTRQEINPGERHPRGTTRESGNSPDTINKSLDFILAENVIKNVEHNDGERIARRTTRQKTNPGERHPRGTTRESGNSPDNINKSSNLPNESASGAGVQHGYSGTSPMSPDPEEEFPDSMLAYIGPNITARNQGLKIGQPIADNWLALARSGLPKENVDELLGKYPIPENCPGLGGPTLNPELKLTLAAHAIKRDSYQLALQNQLGSALSALGQAFSKTLKQNPEDETSKAINAALGDTGRILTDLHYKLSTTRRSFILPGLNLLSKNVATEGPVDTLLFGESFTERVKTASTLEKAGKDMLKSASGSTRSVAPKAASGYTQKQYLNSKPPVKKYNQKKSYQAGGNLPRNKVSQHWDSKHRSNHRR